MSGSKTPLTQHQKFGIMKAFVALQAVNSVYGSGKNCNTTGKENLAFKAWDKLLQQLETKTGMFSNMTEIQVNEFSVVSMRYHSKLMPEINGHTVWERGMKARRDLTDGLQPSKHGNTLKFITLKPMTTVDVTPKGDEFDLTLEVPSGKTEEDELDRLLLKVIELQIIFEHYFIMNYCQS